MRDDMGITGGAPAVSAGIPLHSDRAEILSEHARALDKAEAEWRQIPALTAEDPELSIAEAYAIQCHNIDRRCDTGRCRVGWKVGLTSQRDAGVTGHQRARLRRPA